MPEPKQGPAPAAPAAAAPETLSAILAEMRGLADHRAADAGGERPAIELLRSYASRIEAAAERERDEDRQLAAIAESDEAFARCARCDRPERSPGSAAAMREALEYIAWESREAINSQTTGEERANVLAAYLIDFRDTANAALAAPARNCDRYATAKDALGAFIREKEITSADVDNMNLRDFFDWLFAPAEGGAE